MRHHSDRSITIRYAITLAAVVAVAWTCAAADLTIDDRVAYHRLVEEVYWQHRIWPEGNTGAKPSLAEVLPETILRQRVEDALRKSHALAERWQLPITTEDLQTELDRMVRDTAAPERLDELFQALGRDPYLLAEILARPLIADRRARDAFGSDGEIHAAVRRRAEIDAGDLDSIGDMRSSGGTYREIEWLRLGDGDLNRTTAGPVGPSKRILLDSGEWAEKTTWLDERIGDAVPGEVGDLREDPDRLSVMAVLERSDRRIRLATIEWPKPDFDTWWAANGEQYAAEGLSERGDYEIGTVKSISGTPDSWQIIGSAGSPPHARSKHSTIFTGSEMIVWGGDDGIGYVYSGSRYNPATDSWSAMSNTGHPLGRMDHTAVWTGSKMIVWGGDRGALTDTGARYDPTADTWALMTTSGVPDARVDHTAVWLSGRMVVWGGWDGSSHLDDGRAYNPSTGLWASIAVTDAPSARSGHTAITYRSFQGICGIFDYEAMVVFGGQDSGGVLGDGAYLCLGTPGWTALPTAGAPSARSGHSAVMARETYRQMIIWGGNNGSTDLITGAIWEHSYVTQDQWKPMNLGGAPTARQGHSAVWSETGMMVWGGRSGATLRNTGAIYNPDNNVWLPMTTTGAPSARKHHTAVWDGGDTSASGEMIVWGGDDGAPTSSGRRYSKPADFIIRSYPRTVVSVPGGYEPLSVSTRVYSSGWFSDPVVISNTAFPGSLTIWNDTLIPLPNSSTYTDIDVWVDAGAAVGDHSFFIKGVSGATSRFFAMTLRVQDFDLSCQPSLVSVAPGGSADVTCTVSSVASFDDSVELGCPGGSITCSSSPSSVTPPQNGTVDAQLTITVDASMNPGSYTIYPTALSHFAERISPIDVVVQNPGDLIFADGFESSDTSAWL